MSSGQKRCAEDEDDWDDLKARAGITRVSWPVYSREAYWAKIGHEKFNITGDLLIKYVNIEKDFDMAKQVYTDKINLLKKVLEL